MFAAPGQNENKAVKPNLLLPLFISLLLMPAAALPQPQPLPLSKSAEPYPQSINLIAMFGDGVTFRVPAGWTKAYQQRNDKTAIIEFVPEGQTVDAWRELISVQAFKDLPPQMSPQTVIERMLTAIRDHCGRNAIAIPLGERMVDGQPGFAAITGCASMPRPTAGAQVGQGESAYYLAVRGPKDMHLFQRAVRGPAFLPGNSPINAGNVSQIYQSLNPIKFCDLSKPAKDCVERAPR